MALGANDMLGFPTAPSGGKRAILWSGQIPTGLATVNSRLIYSETTGLVDESNGQFTQIIDPVYGDRVIINVAGLYRVAFRCLAASQFFSAIYVNLPRNIALAGTDPNDVWNASTGSRRSVRSFCRTGANDACADEATMWLLPGDEISFGMSASPSSSTQSGYIVEKML